MPAVRAILSALARATHRQFGTFGALKVNNLFLLIALMVWGAASSGVAPVSAEPLIILLVLLSLFPLSSDPLALIPRVRRALWPLGLREQILLWCFSFLVSPVVWLAAAAAVLTSRVRVGIGVLVLSAGIHMLKTLLRWSTPSGCGLDWLRRIPQMPGLLGGLILHDLRGIMSTLDPYAAIVFSAGGTIYRVAGANVDPYAPAVLSLLVGLCLSTYAQCLFGLDVTGTALTRYRLFPLRGWQILLAKDIAFFLVVTMLVAPLSLSSGWTFGLTALAIGHHPSVMMLSPIHRWRFSGNRLFPGVVQAILASALSFWTHQGGAMFLGVAAVLYGLSLAIYGWRFQLLLRPAGGDIQRRNSDGAA